MNCREGDLAISVGGDRPEFIGRVVAVLRRYEGPQVWRQKADWVVEWRGHEYAALDRLLRPIRDPGEDARDETLDWLPVPSTQEPSHA